MGDRGVTRRRRVVALAIGLDVLAAALSVAIFVLTGNVIVLAFGVILGLAPWAAVIDDIERARRERDGG